MRASHASVADGGGTAQTVVQCDFRGSGVAFLCVGVGLNDEELVRPSSMISSGNALAANDNEASVGMLQSAFVPVLDGWAARNPTTNRYGSKMDAMVKE